MDQLVNKKPSRFFAIGCSFTMYNWTTWPEIIAYDLNIEEYYNLGRPGAGNEFIFNRLMQVDQIYNLNENDLVMICWTNISREDRFIGDWITPGNIFTQGEYNKDFVKKYYMNYNTLLHDFSYVKASRMLLSYKNVKWHFLQMLPIFEYINQYSKVKCKPVPYSALIEVEKNYFKPSFYEILWDNDIEKKMVHERNNFNIHDPHPSPKEHLEYLSKIFNHIWQEKTIDTIELLEQEYLNVRLNNLHYQNFNHLKQSLDAPKIF